MPWTNKQFRFLMSSGSPLTEAQKDKDKAEAHANPAMVHEKRKSPYWEIHKGREHGS